MFCLACELRAIISRSLTNDTIPICLRRGCRCGRTICISHCSVLVSVLVHARRVGNALYSNARPPAFVPSVCQHGICTGVCRPDAHRNAWLSPPAPEETHLDVASILCDDGTGRHAHDSEGHRRCRVRATSTTAVLNLRDRMSGLGQERQQTARQREQLVHSTAFVLSQPRTLRERLAEVIRLPRSAAICTAAAFHLPTLDECFFCVHDGLSQLPSQEGAEGLLLDELEDACMALLGGASPPSSVAATDFGTWCLDMPLQPTEGAPSHWSRLFGRLLLVPLQAGEEKSGLLLVAGTRDSLFSPETVACLETIAAMSALAVAAELARARLVVAQQEISLQRKFMPICAHCKKIRDDEGYWNDFETFMARHFDTSFSHGICPECLSRHYPQLRLRQS